jgi:serine/threonine protein kinase
VARIDAETNLMNASQASHPTDKVLNAYGLGKLDDASAESVNAHLEGCPDCQQRVAALSSDSFLGRLRDAKARPESLHPAVSSSAGLSILESGSGAAAPPPPGSLPPGLADHPDYEVVRELGQGGMGVVYLAQNKMMGRLEVLKVVSEQLIKRRGVIDRFLGEIRNAARLHHPNVVTAYSTVRLGESIALAMEYVDGLDLARLVKARGPLPVANACNYIHQAALGLQHAHEHGMVHRDIKPTNLMLTKQGSRALIKVLDFGLAKVKSEGAVDGGLTHEGQMLGTPHYIAPEQTIDARKADIRADIYSLGCTFYYLLTGEPPFDGTSLYDILQAHHSREALPLNLARPEVPLEVAAIVAKMMAKERERRFEEPKEVAQALKPFFKAGSVPSVGSKPDISQLGRIVADPRASKIAVEPVQSVTAVTPTSGARKSPEKTQSDPPWNSLIDLCEKEPLHDSLLDPPGQAAASAAKQKGPGTWPTPVANLGRQVPGAWWTIAGVFLICLTVAWAAGVLKVKTPDGVIVLEGVPTDAVVEIDGHKITVVPKEGTPIKIEKPKGKYYVQVNCAGDRLLGESVTLESGKELKLTVRIDSAGEAGLGGGMMGQMMKQMGEQHRMNGSRTGMGMGGMMGGGQGIKDAGAMGDGMTGMMGGQESGESNSTKAMGGMGMGMRGMGGMMGGPKSEESNPPTDMGMGMTGGMMKAMSGGLGAQGRPGPGMMDDEQGFIQLFNGTDFTGLVAGNRDLTNWEIEDGALVSRKGHNRLFTEAEFHNFIIRFEFQIGENTMSSVGFWSFPGDVPAWVFLDNTRNAMAAVTWRNDDGAFNVSRLKPPAKLRPAGNWNEMEIQVNDDHIVVKLNGKRLSDERISLAINAPRRDPNLHRQSGQFAFESPFSTGAILYRNIRAKRLD